MAITATTPANSGPTTKQRLNDLIERFLADAKEIDPAIEGAYIGYDGPVFDRPFIVSLVINLERADGWKVSDNQPLTPSLQAAMQTFAAAESAFRKHVNLHGKDETETDALWEAKEAAEFALIRHPCRTIEDVRAKARLAIADENVFDSISNCTIDGEHELYVFLRSLLGTQ